MDLATAKRLRKHGSAAIQASHERAAKADQTPKRQASADEVTRVECASCHRAFRVPAAKRQHGKSAPCPHCNHAIDLAPEAIHPSLDQPTLANPPPVMGASPAQEIPHRPTRRRRAIVGRPQSDAASPGLVIGSSVVLGAVALALAVLAVA